MIVHASLFGIGISEMVIIAAIALVVIGPERFPEFARIVVRTIRDVRGYVDEAKQELDKELRPITREIKQLEQYQPKRYFDDITNKPKPATPSKTQPPDSPQNEGEVRQTAAESSDAVPAGEADGGETEASPEPEATTPYQPPPTEADFDRNPTAFPKASDTVADPYPDEEEPYRD